MHNTDPRVRVITDQVYSRAGGADRMADVYIPGSKVAPPVVLWLHGGGWRFGDRHLAPDLATFAKQSGLAIVSIDYRLSDEAKFPAAVEDVKTAVRWVRRVAGEFELNGNRIGLWGSSAGGHLAACAAMSRESDFVTGEHPGISSQVHAVVDGYGPTNFARIDVERTNVASAGTDAESLGIGKVLPASDPDSFESRFLGRPVGTSPMEVELADPVHYVRKECPPFLILHGGSDSLIPPSQSRYLYDALSQTENDAILVLFQNLKHGFFNNARLAEEDYGAVTVLCSPMSELEAKWSCPAGASIPTMVTDFFRVHLVPGR